MTAKLENEIEALKLENIALRERVLKVEGANNVLSKRILGAIAIIESGDKIRDARIGDIEITVASNTLDATNFAAKVVESVRDAKNRGIRV